MFEEEEKFISGIFNYCDRWCGRCPLTARCRVYAMDEFNTGDERDAPKLSSRNLKNIFVETKALLREAAAARGIDIDALDLREAGESLEQKRSAIEQQELMKLAEKYTKQAKMFLQAQDLTGEAIDLTRLEMLQIIGWYHFFIAAKINRALYAEAEYAEDADFEAFCSFGDGSIKIALIGIDRSIVAWRALLDESTLREIKPLIQLLETLRRRCEEKFPNARDFLRPGFDEIEMVM